MKGQTVKTTYEAMELASKVVLLNCRHIVNGQVQRRSFQNALATLAEMNQLLLQLRALTEKKNKG